MPIVCSTRRSVPPSDLKGQARHAVASSCRGGAHPPCIVLGYFQELLDVLDRAEATTLSTICEICGNKVRLVG
jgi:hypothetical protein